MSDKDEHKALKKLAKARAKSAKKGQPATDQEVGQVPEEIDLTQAGRTSEADKSRLTLERWKVIIAAASALIALVSLIVLLLRS